MVDEKVKELTDKINLATENIMRETIRDFTGSRDDKANQYRCELVRPMRYPGKELLKIDGIEVLLISNPIVKEVIGEGYRITFELVTRRMDQS